MTLVALGVSNEAYWAPSSCRGPEACSGWEVEDDGLRLGSIGAGRVPGHRPYFTVDDLPAALGRIRDLGVRSSIQASGGPSAEIPRAAHSR